MRKTIAIFIVLLSVLTFSCSKNKLTEKNFKISGVLEQGANKKLFISEMTPEGFNILDTIAIDKENKFSFMRDYKEPTIYVIQTNPDDYITILPKGNEDIIINGIYDEFSNSYTVKNSPESELLFNLNKDFIRTNAALVAIKQTLHQNLYEENINEIKKELFAKYSDLENHQKTSLKEFISKNKGSLTCCIALYRTFDSRPLFDYRKDLDVYEDVLNGLTQKNPNNPHTKALKNHIDNIKKLNTQQQDKQLADKNVKK